MIKVFFIRHAKAGNRYKWSDPDHLRPLTRPGREQADTLAALLDPEKITRIFSSYYVRCVQTVEPLANARGLEVEPHEALVEGAPTSAALDLIQGAIEPIAACTHGDVMENVVGHLKDAGVDGADPDLAKKGSTWVFTVDDGRVVGTVYLEPTA